MASQHFLATSGVPQRSLVGPLLFIIFINDLPDVIQERTNSALYADDTKLYRSIFSVSDSQDLQRDLSSMDARSHKSNMNFNASKCKVLTITRKTSPVTQDYHLGSKVLQRVREEKELGITITSDLSWKSHVLTIVSKANKMLGQLKRTCPLITDTRIRRTLYLSLVKSQLCYAPEVGLG